MPAFIKELRTVLLNYIETGINILLKAKIIQCNLVTYLPFFLLRAYEAYIKMYRMQLDNEVHKLQKSTLMKTKRDQLGINLPYTKISKWSVTKFCSDSLWSQSLVEYLYTQQHKKITAFCTPAYK